MVGVGAFGGLHSMTPRACNKASRRKKALLCHNLVVVERVKVKANRIPDGLHLQITPDVQWFDERRRCTRTKSSSSIWAMLVVSPDGSFLDCPHRG